MALFTDDFTGTDNDLVSARTGWTAGTPGTDNTKINGSNAVKFTDTSNDSCVVYNEKGAADHWCECVAGADFAGGYFPLIIRNDGTRSNFYAARFEAGLWEIWIANGGSLNRQENVAGSVTAGDVIRFEGVGTVATLKKNGTTILTHTSLAFGTNTKVGTYPRSTVTGASVMDNWRSGLDGEGSADTTDPVLTSVSGTDTGSTSATVSVSSTEAGPGWAVLTASATTPSDAQIKAGQNHLGSSSGVFLDTAALAIGSNPGAFVFTGLTPGATYFPHVVSDDTATPTANTAIPVSGASFTMPAPDVIDPVFAGGTTLNAGTKTNSSIALSTSAVATDNIAVTGYEWSSDNGATYPFTSLTNSFTFTALADLTSYNFRVRAYDAAGNRSAHLALTTSTYRAGATGQVILDDTGPVGDNPAGILHNDVEAGDEGKWFSYVITTPPVDSDSLTIDALGRFTWVGLSADEFYYQLEVDGVNVGSPVLVSLDPAGPPDEVLPELTGDITVTNLTTTSYDLSWPTGTDDTGVTGYEYSLNGGADWTSNSTATAKSVTGRTPGATDQVRVRCFDGAGNRSTPALATSVTLLDETIPPGPPARRSINGHANRYDRVFDQQVTPWPVKNSSSTCAAPTRT